MKRIFLTLIALFQLTLGQTEDTLTFKDGSKLVCTIQEMGASIKLVDKYNSVRYEHLQRVSDVYVSGLGTIYQSGEYVQEEGKGQKYVKYRTNNRRGTGLIIGGGGRGTDSKIQNHLGGYSGPIFIMFGLEKGIPDRPFSFELVGEAGLGGSMMNDLSETYSYFDLKLGAKLCILSKVKKLNLFISGGLQYITSTIDDNVDGNYSDFLFDSNSEFSEGILEVSDSGFGGYLEIGLKYRASNSFDIEGLVQMSFVDLDFKEFKSPALGTGGGLRLIYYRGM